MNQNQPSETADDFKVSIIIVNWNGIAFLPGCIESLVKYPPTSQFETVILDNRSTDGSAEWLESIVTEQSLSRINPRYIQTGANLGFGRANNLGILATKSPIVFLLNPDTVVKEGAIDHLIGVLESSERIGATVPKLLHADGTLQPSVWGSPTPVNTLIENVFYKFLPAHFVSKRVLGRFWDHSETRPVPLVCAAAMMIKRSVLDSVGAFDEEFHMYGEDFDLALRIVQGGWDLYFVHDAEVHHLFGQSSTQRWTNFEKLATMEGGSILYQKKRMTSFGFVGNLMARIFVYSALILRNLSNLEKRKGYSKLVKINLRALRENFFIFGERT